MKKICFVIIFVAPVVFLACRKDNVVNKNRPPIAFAGPDLTLADSSGIVELMGKGIDVDGTIVMYNWKMLFGPAPSNIANPDAVTKVTGLVLGTYEFELKVTDDGGLSAADEVRVYVIKSSNDPGDWDY